jgi:hypothetical protein
VKLIIILVLTYSVAGYAKVFTFDTESYASYVRGTGGLSSLQREAYAGGMPSNISFNDNNQTTEAFSGEIGFSYTNPSVATFRLGVELLYPYVPGGSTGSTGTLSQFTLATQAYSIIPQVNAEIFLKKKPTYRIYLGLGSGYALTTIKNTYTMTSGSSLGLNNYIEQGTGSGIMGQGYLGIEFPAFDNVSFSFDVGYRYLVVNNFTASGGYTSPLGTFNQGSPIVNADGSNRSVNLGGVFAAVNLRFYFNNN